MRVSLETSLGDSFTSKHLRLLQCLYQTIILKKSCWPIFRLSRWFLQKKSSNNAKKDPKDQRFGAGNLDKLIFNLHFLRLFEENAYLSKHFRNAQDDSFQGDVFFKVNCANILSEFSNMFKLDSQVDNYRSRNCF